MKLIFSKIIAISIISLFLNLMQPPASADSEGQCMIELEFYRVASATFNVYFPEEDYHIDTSWQNNDDIVYSGMNLSMKVEKDSVLIFSETKRIYLGNDGYRDNFNSDKFQFPENGKYQISVELEDGFLDNDVTWEVQVGGYESPVLSIEPPPSVKIGEEFTVQITVSESASFDVFVAEPDGSNKIRIGVAVCKDDPGTYDVELTIRDVDLQEGPGNYQLVLDRHRFKDDPQTANIKVEAEDVPLISEENPILIQIILLIVIIFLILVIIIMKKKKGKKDMSPIPDNLEVIQTPAVKTVKKTSQNSLLCGSCQSGMTFVNEYNKWYCESCNQYF
jgi:hypothetical protein